jgi:hypothetical protein
VIVSPEPTYAPIHVAFLAPADADFQCPRDDLIQRRVAGKGVRQVARVVRVRAAKLDRGRRTAGLAVARIRSQETDWAEGNTNSWIEPAENVLPIEGSKPAARI